MALFGAFAEFTRRGESIERGVVALDGANPTPVTTKFKTISAVFLTLRTSSAPGLSTSLVTYALTGNTVNIYGWKPTSAANPTLIASDGTDSVAYIIVGKR